MISRTAVMVLHALTFLADRHDRMFVDVVVVARRIGAKPNYLSKVLQRFVHEGIVESRRGQGGGFRLARLPSEIPLLEVVDAIDRIRIRGRCLLGGGDCSDVRDCAVHARWGGIRDAFLDFLECTTIGDLLRHGTERGMGGWDRSDVGECCRG